MDIFERIPSVLRHKVLHYLQCPIAKMVKFHLKLPNIIKYNLVISELNKFNWFSYHSMRHLKKIFRMHGTKGYRFKISLFNSCKAYMYNKFWGDGNDETWRRRSLFGGVYPVRVRPKVRAPRNPWTRRWNMRWNREGELQQLCKTTWTRDAWRGCGLLDSTPGDLIVDTWGNIFVWLGKKTTDFEGNELKGGGGMSLRGRVGSFFDYRDASGLYIGKKRLRWYTGYL